MVEYAYAVIKNKKCMYFNFSFIFTKECDCMNKRENKDIIKDLYPHIEGSYQFHYAHSLGTGELSYQIKEIK